MNKPLVYYAISLFIGCFSTAVFYDNFLIGAVIAASFLLVIFFTIPKRFFILVLAFFFVGVINFNIFFNVQIEGKTIDIRVKQNKDYYYIGEYKNRSIILTGNISKLEEGDKIAAAGNFKEEKNYPKGSIGSYNIETYEKYNKDFIYKIYNLKRILYERFRSELGDEKTALVMALCFGETKYLTLDQKSEFQKLGVVHAVSVSGFHLAIIYKLLDSLLGLKASIIISFLYIIFTGLQAATVRAFLMILVLKLSKKVYKNYDALSSLSLSAMILLLYKPYYPLDIGFMLSFLATLGILLYNKKFQQKLYKLPKEINDSLSITLSSQCFSMPYAAFTLKNFSLGFILGNLVLLPLYSLIVVLGNLAFLISFIKPLFKVMNLLVYTILTAIEGGSYILSKLSPPVSILTYTETLVILMLYFSFVLYKHGYNKWRYFPVFLFFIVLTESYRIFPEVNYLNIGTGSDVLIKYKTKSLLILSKHDEAIIKEMKPDKVIEDNKEDYTIKLGSNYIIKVTNEKDNNLSNNIEIAAFNERTILTRNVNDFEDEKYGRYDIIKVPQKKYFSNSSSLNKSDYLIKYKVIFNKVYVAKD